MPQSINNYKDNEIFHSYTTPKRKGEFIPFIMFGVTGYTGYTDLYTMDTLSLLLNLTKSEQKFLLRFFSNFDKTTNMSIITAKQLTKSERNKASLAFKSLHNKSIIKKLKREHYMINPTFLVPPPEHRDSIVNIWLNT